MSREEVSQIIRQIIAKVAGLPIEELQDEHKLKDELMLDSLKEMEIVARTEIQFGISLEEGDLLCLQTLGEYCDLVMKSLLVPK